MNWRRWFRKQWKGNAPPQPQNPINPALLAIAPALQDAIGYRFKNLFLLEKALTHTSYAASQERAFSYERLEFLGDAVLELVVSEFLFQKHRDLNEGTLTKYRTILVNTQHLADQARELSLGQWILTAKSLNYHDKPAISSGILADVMEALIAAIYMDGGLEAATNFVKCFIITDQSTYVDELQSFNYKGQLIERCQRNNMGTPEYEITKTTGPDHEPSYIMQVVINGEVLGFGEGHSKKEASQMAAEDALKNWDTFFNPNSPTS
ncbi:MAG: ribonuclease III [Candidatus Marinimicrobia bacterium]|nr:ribonuclease III [Candidatus Neomarinimicrobiota bacterium]MCF7839413.1 ribonuclease III [Candidatus Neomarinimicrobiota bacterium]MCF7902940.1 ribonuclease III [Candidatus Neomarinimicrobiota bacterium]